MKILLTVNSMDNLSGSVLSTYELARVLSKEHDVTVVCGQGGWMDNEVKNNLEGFGVKCSYEWDKEYDLIYCCHYCPPVSGYKINIVRGITEWEKPLGADFYVCIRPDIQEHIIKEHGIPREKTVVIYNGVDRERFKPTVRTPRNHTKIVAPCNIDSLRFDWLLSMVDILNEDRQLYIYTKETKFKLPDSPWIHYEKPTFHMEKVIADADVVVGIYLGRVNLEARSCGVPSIMYDPFTLHAEPFEITEDEFDERHNIENTVKSLLNIYEQKH